MLRNIRTRFALGVFGLSIGLSLPFSGVLAAEGPKYGLLGLYKVANTKTYEANLKTFEQTLNGDGCSIRREGGIGKEDGDVDIAKPNRFFVLECANPLLRSTKSRALFSPLNKDAKMIALLEGEITRAMDGPDSAGKRQYILKVSHYNNADPDGRAQDLADIETMVTPRPDRYDTEVHISVSHAVGMATPDEAVVIYYDDSEQGKRFRKANPDVLKKIGGFNKKHLTDSIYYYGASKR